MAKEKLIRYELSPKGGYLALLLEKLAAENYYGVLHIAIGAGDIIGARLISPRKDGSQIRREIDLEKIADKRDTVN